MSEPLFRVVVTATGETRDADGNLVSSTPVTFEPQDMTAAELAALGIEAPPHPNKEK